MIVNVYITMCPGMDRPFVSTSPPPETLEKKNGTMVWRAVVEVPGFDKVDGVIQALAMPFSSAFPDPAGGPLPPTEPQV